MKSPDKKPAIAIRQLDTYLTMVRASEGATMYRTLWADVDGVRRDILDNGRVSCAFYVCSMLFHFRLIEQMHATITGLEADLKRSGWRQVEHLVPGAVIIWEKAVQEGGEAHEHVGIYLGEYLAVSHSDKTKTPVIHERYFGSGKDLRRIRAIYVHDFLSQ